MTSSTNRIGIVGAVLLLMVASTTACKIADLSGICYSLSGRPCREGNGSGRIIYIYDLVTINPGGVLAPSTVTTTVRPTPTLQPVIEWINRDSLTHRLVSDTPLFDTGDIDPMALGEIRLSRSGRFSYQCARHPTMVGTIIVR